MVSQPPPSADESFETAPPESPPQTPPVDPDDVQEGFDLAEVFPEKIGKSRWFRWSLVLLTVLGVVVCSGVVNWTVHSTMDSDSERWVVKFRDHPIITERIGASVGTS